MKAKIDYFLNAVFYFLWLKDKWFSNVITRSIRFITAPIFNAFSSESRKKKYNKRQAEVDILFNDVKYGMTVDFAERTFYLLAVFYSFMISFPIILLSVEYDIYGGEIISVLAGVVIYLIPAFYFARNVIWDKKYVRYFEEFQQKDDQWRIQWRFITAIFYIGAFVLPVMEVIIFVTVF